MPLDPIAIVVLRAMDARGLSISTVADRATLHRSTLSRWLCGRRQLKSNALARVLAALDLAVGDRVVPREKGPLVHLPTLERQRRQDRERDP